MEKSYEKCIVYNSDNLINIEIGLDELLTSNNTLTLTRCSCVFKCYNDNSYTYSYPTDYPNNPFYFPKVIIELLNSKKYNCFFRDCNAVTITRDIPSQYSNPKQLMFWTSVGEIYVCIGKIPVSEIITNNYSIIPNVVTDKIASRLYSIIKKDNLFTNDRPIPDYISKGYDRYIANIFSYCIHKTIKRVDTVSYKLIDTNTVTKPIYSKKLNDNSDINHVTRIIAMVLSNDPVTTIDDKLVNPGAIIISHKPLIFEPQTECIIAYVIYRTKLFDEPFDRTGC